MIVNENRPSLRFPEFEEKLNTYYLGDFTEWASGGTPSKQIDSYWNGNIPWISASSMKGLVYKDSELKITSEGLKKGSKLAEKGSLLILVRGSMLFNKIPIGIAGMDVSFNQDLKSIKVKEKSTSKYILQWFFSIESSLMSMVTGTGIGAGKLDLTDLKALKISLPSLPEQQKIASFLTAVDDKLHALKQKHALLEQYKKGVMQQLFSGKLRFKDEDGKDFPEWEEKKLGEYLIKHFEISTEHDQYPVLTSSRRGLYFQKDYFNGQDVASKDTTGYNVVPRGFFTYRHMSDDLDFKFNINHLCDRGIVSTLYPVFTTNESLDDNFLVLKLNNGIEFQKYAVLQKQGGSRTYMYFKKLEQLIINFPSLTEQTKIVSFISVLDEKINQCQAQIAKTEVWKKGLLQQLFV